MTGPLSYRMDVFVVDDPMVDDERIADALGDGASVRTGAVDSEADLVAAASEADALVVDVNTPVTADVLDACDSLRIVARAGVGVDNVDVKAAADHQIVVTNVPEYCHDEVATHSVALLLSCLRRVSQLDRDVKAGRWDWGSGGSIHRLAGSTLGLVSYGPIARKVATQVQGFDIERVAYDPFVDDGEMAETGVEKVSFDGLLERSDLVIVLAPLTDDTRGLIDAEALDRLPDHAVLVNTGRGGVVDEPALADALQAGDVAAAGLDVLETEPPTESPLQDCENAVLTPHAGWYSVEARTDLNDTIARNLQAVDDGETPPDRIDPDGAWV